MESSVLSLCGASSWRDIVSCLLDKDKHLWFHDVVILVQTIGLHDSDILKHTCLYVSLNFFLASVVAVATVVILAMARKLH